MNPTLPTYILEFLEKNINPTFETWLIGSRANNTASERSDWDLLIFGNRELLFELSNHSPIREADIFVVTDGNRFKSPWADESGSLTKQGDLADWKWQKHDGYVASYIGVSKPDKWGVIRPVKLQAIRIERSQPDV